MFRSVKGRLKVVGGVMEGEGFAAATKRGVLSLLVSMATGVVKTKVFSSVGPACDWLAEQSKVTGVCPPPIELQACVLKMRG
jgi:hypothetical protein